VVPDVGHKSYRRRNSPMALAKAEDVPANQAGRNQRQVMVKEDHDAGRARGGGGFPLALDRRLDGEAHWRAHEREGHDGGGKRAAPVH